MRALPILFAIALVADAGATRGQVAGPRGNGNAAALPTESSAVFWAAAPMYFAMPCIAGDVHHASTAAESASRGSAAVIQAWGVWNLLTSEAMKNLEAAREKNLDNNLKAVKTYFDVREENRCRREVKPGVRRTAEDYARYAKEGKPRPLGPAELDPLTGEISWPGVLRCQEYVAQREALAQVFAQRAVSGALDQDQLQKVREATDAMARGLKGQMGAVPPNTWIAAKRFLESMAYEASQPATLLLGPALATR